MSGMFRRMLAATTLILLWPQFPVAAETSGGKDPASPMAKCATVAYLPCLAGYPAPFAAVYEDRHNVFRVHEWRREAFPVRIAAWTDGTVVWSLDERGARAPYAIGRVPKSSLLSLIAAIDSEAMFDSSNAAKRVSTQGVSDIASVAADGRAVTFQCASEGEASAVGEQADFAVLKGLLESIVTSATLVTTRTLSFDQRCVSAMQPVFGPDRWQRLPGEVRAVWSPDEFLRMSPEKQDTVLALLSANGFNTVCVQTQYREAVQYPGSEYLYQSYIEDINRFAIDTMVGNIRDKNLRAEAWPEYGFYASYDKETTESFGRFLIRHPELAAIDKGGRDYFFNPKYGYYKSLCPANPESHKLLIGLYCEMLEKFPFDGLNLDRIRFPNADFCYCGYCKKQFAADTGTSLTVFAEGSGEWKTWMKWRQDRVQEFVHALSSTVRTRFPGRTITACVVMPEEIEAKGQNWPEWLRLGYVDAVVPLLYSAPSVASGMAAIQSAVPDQSRVIYGLQPYEGVGEEICKMRQAGGRGYAVWHIGTLTPAARDAFQAANTPFGPGPITLGERR
jgi:uncharacterized lipoprotein YddW (UPF0748 family)